MKVLFVATAYKRYEGDVITPWLTELVRQLRDKEVDVSIFTSSYKGLGNQVINNVKIHRFRYCFKKYETLTHEETVVDRIKKGPFYLALTLLYMFFGTISIIKLVKKEHFDIVHIHWPFPHIIFGAFAKVAGQTRLFSTFYGVEIRWLKKKFPFLQKPVSLLLNKSDCISAISTHTAKELYSITDQTIPIIPFSAVIVKGKGDIKDNQEIIFVGRLVERKGIKYLIRALSEIKDDIKHKLIIIGDGPERQALEELTRQFKIEDRVKFTGRISDENLYRYYRYCSFLVLPAVYDKKGDIEGLGVVLIEAMSHLKPVIASSAGGITDVVEDGVNGLLVPPGDVSALAQAIRTLATDTKLRKEMGERAKKSIDERFNWDKIVNKLISLYRQGEINGRF